MRVGFDVEGRPTSRADRPRSDIAIVTPTYFATMGIPLVKGRDFTEQDQRDTPLVVVVNQAFAHKYFPGEDPIGKRIQPGVGKPPTPLREIVGVVGDARQSPFGIDPNTIYYLPYKQLPWFIGTIVVRAAIPPAAVESAARAALTDLDRQVPCAGCGPVPTLRAKSWHRHDSSPC